MAGPLDPFVAVYTHRDRAARAWKAAGGKVVGTIGEGVPEELVAAAGFLPYRLSGDPRVTLANVRRYLHASFNKAQSERPIRLGWVEAIIEQLLDGTYDFVDYLVIPYSRKEVAQVHGKLRDIARDHPRFRFPDLYLLDRAALPTARAAAYNRARLAKLREQLERWAGRTIGDGDMARAIDDSNRGRALLTGVQCLRGDRITGRAALAIIGSSRMMARAAHNAHLLDLLAGAADLPRVSGIRVFAAGSAPDTDAFYATIEDAGGQVVGENHDWGHRIFETPVATDRAPFDAIVDRASATPPVLTYPLAESAAQCVERAVQARAEAAVFRVHADDSFQLFDTPDERAALAEAGIPSLALDEQPYAVDRAATTHAVAAFFKDLQ